MPRNEDRDYPRSERDAYDMIRGWQERKPAPQTLAEVFNAARQAQENAIASHAPALQRLHDIVAEVRDELKTTEVGFDVGSPALLRSLGVSNAEAHETYGVITVKQAKFLLKMGDNETTHLYLRNLMGTHDIDARQCFRDRGFQTLLLNHSSSVKKLKEVMAQALGQLTALEDLNQYNLPAVKPSDDGKKSPRTGTIIG